MSAPRQEGGQQPRKQLQAAPPAGRGRIISITPRHNAALHHPVPPALGAQQLLPGDFSRAHLLLEARGSTPVTVIVVVRPQDVPHLPPGYQQRPTPAWLAAEPLGDTPPPADTVDSLQRQCVASSAGSVVVAQLASTLGPAPAAAAGAPGSGLVLNCSCLAGLARWWVSVVEVVALRVLALHLWSPSGMKRPAGRAGGQQVAVKKEPPAAVPAAAAAAAAGAGLAAPAATGSDSDEPIGAKMKRRRLMKALEEEVDLTPALPAGWGRPLGEGRAGPEQVGLPGLPGLPSPAMLPAHTSMDDGAQDSKSGVWRDTQTAIAASAAMAAAAAAAAVGAPSPPAAAAAVAESGAARSGRTVRPAVTRLYSGTGRAWVEAVRSAVEAAVAGGWAADSGGPPPTLVAVAKGRPVQLEGQVWYYPLRYMQPRNNDSQLSVPVTLLKGLDTEGVAGATHPVTLVPLVPRAAAEYERVELEGPPVPPHIIEQLPCCGEWAAVADIPTHTNCNKALVGTKAGFDAFRPLTGWHMVCGFTDVGAQTVYVALLPPGAAVVKANLKEGKAAATAAGYPHLLNYPGQLHFADNRGPRTTKAATCRAAPLLTGASSVSQPLPGHQEAAAVSNSSPPGSQGLPPDSSFGADATEGDVPEVDAEQVAAAETPVSSGLQPARRRPLFTSWRDLSLGSSGVAAWLKDFPAAMERLSSSQQQEEALQQLLQQERQPPPGGSYHLGWPPAEPCSTQGSGSCGVPSSSSAQGRSRQGLYTPSAASRGWRLPADKLRRAVAQAWGGQVPVDTVELSSLSRVRVSLVVAGQQPASTTAPLLAMLLPASAATATAAAAAAAAAAAHPGADGGRAPSHYWLVGEGLSRTLCDLVAYSIMDVTGVPPPAPTCAAPASWPFHRQAVRDLRPHLALHLSQHGS